MKGVTLKDLGHTVGDLVVYNSDDESTGGVIYQISENCDPVTPASVKKTWPQQEFDEKGKRIPPMKIAGYVRLKPMFEFFPTNRGKQPKGKGSTVLVYHSQIERGMKKIDITTLGVKYMELGNMIRNVAVAAGFEVAPSE